MGLLLEGQFGILLLAGIIWFVYHANTGVQHKEKNSQTCRQYVHDRLVNVRTYGPSPLAKGKAKLVKCGVATPYVPMYRRSEVLRVEAFRLAKSVARGKRVVASHIQGGRMGTCAPKCRVSTVIAGVVQDRKALKSIEYDQPF